MFNFLKKAPPEKSLVAPVDGTVIDLSDVPDDVFAQRIVGDGVAIEMTGSEIVSPCSGKLSMVFRTGHAFGLTTPDGIEVLVHIGIDTVALKGEGFTALLEAGCDVAAGTPVIRIDDALLRKKGVPMYTPILITNQQKVKGLKPCIGERVTAGRDVILSYKLATQINNR